MKTIGYKVMLSLDRLEKAESGEKAVQLFITAVNKLNHGFSIAYRRTKPASKTGWIGIAKEKHRYGFFVMKGNPASVAPEFPVLFRDAVKSLGTILETFELRNRPADETNIMKDEIRKKSVRVSRGSLLTKSVQRLTKVGSWELDVAKRIMNWNEEMYRIYGLKPGRSGVVSRENRYAALACHDPDDQTKLLKAIKKCVNKRTSFDLEFLITNRKGRRLWIRSTARAVRKNGRIDRVIGHFIDVTDRKKAEEALHESEVMYRTTVDSMADSIHLVDRDLRILFLNRSFRRWCDDLGLDAEPAGRTVFEAFPFLPVKVRHEYNHVFETGKMLITEESTRVDGHLLMTETRKIPIFHGDDVVRVVTVVRDITARKQSEKALEQSETRYRTLVEASKEYIFIVDKQGVIEYVNCKGAELFDLRPEQMVGRELTLFFRPAIKTRIVKSLKDVIKTGKSLYTDFAIPFPGGEKWLGTWLVPLQDPMGRISTVMGVSRDITEQKLAEEALRESETRYNTMFGSLKSGVAVYRPIRNGEDFVCVDFNKAAEHISRVKKQDVLGKRMLELFPQMAKVGLVDAFRRVSRTGIPEHVPPFYYRDAMREGWRENYVYRLPSGEMVGIYDDITDRKEAEEAIRKERDRAQSYLDIAEVMIVAIGPDQKVLLVNKKVCEVLGYRENEIVGKDWIDTALPDKVKAKVRDVFADLMADRVEQRKYAENTVVTKAGKERLIAWHNTVLRDDDGRIIATLSSGEDITERREAESALHESEKRLEMFFAQSLDGFVFMMLDEPMVWNGTVDKEKILDHIFSHQTFTKVNEAMVRQYATTHEHFMKATPNDFFTHNIPLAKKLWREFYDKGRIHLETAMHRFDGTEMWVEGDNVCLYDTEGRITGHFGVQRDVTERKKAEEALRRSEEEVTLKSRITQTLYEISEAVNTSDNLNDLFAKIHRALSRIIRARNFFIALITPEGDKIHFPYEYDEKSPSSAAVISLDDAQSLTAEVIRTKMPLLLNAEELDIRYEKGLSRIWNARPKCWLGVPLVVMDKAIGVMAVQDYDRGDSYSLEDVKVLASTAGQVALAIERKRANDQIKTTLEEKEALLRELYHRTKNNMQVVCAMLDLKAASMADDTLKSVFQETKNRINSMALVHQKLYQSKNLSRINLGEYVKELTHLLMNSYEIVRGRIEIKVDSEDVFVLIDTAIPCGLILNELVTNALKHAFPDNRKGTILVQIHRTEDQYIVLHVSDDGIGLPKGFDSRKKNTMGMLTINALVKQLQGKMVFSGDGRVICQVTFRDNLYQPRV